MSSMPASYTSHSGTSRARAAAPRPSRGPAAVFTNTSSPKFMVPMLQRAHLGAGDERAEPLLDRHADGAAGRALDDDVGSRRRGSRSKISAEVGGLLRGPAVGPAHVEVDRPPPPPCHASTAAAAISAGVYGTAGFCARVISAPTIAAVMIDLLAHGCSLPVGASARPLLVLRARRRCRVARQTTIGSTRTSAAESRQVADAARSPCAPRTASPRGRARPRSRPPPRRSRRRGPARGTRPPRRRGTAPRRRRGG